MIQEVEIAKKNQSKTSRDYRRLKRFDVLQVGDCKKLISPVTEENPEVRYYVSDEELFDAIHDSHIECGHGGRDRLEQAVNKKFVNIPRSVLMVYLSLCVSCEKKKSLPKKGVVVKPLLFNEINQRGQVDLIDMQTCKDGPYKFILVYQEHLSKLVILRPLENKVSARGCTSFN
ncbi:hypothetical protein QAD02_022264 [Eretmocerus hayati]|uniref:Uncharacterized protein n=1 Tax=Eretmocerus hayati TaxID=131215 RepID=A0ACC2PS81_9HYME|nr:hypothetical protein QAD02_022264 [Eretmocerus hayati]